MLACCSRMYVMVLVSIIKQEPSNVLQLKATNWVYFCTIFLRAPFIPYSPIQPVNTLVIPTEGWIMDELCIT